MSSSSTSHDDSTDSDSQPRKRARRLPPVAYKASVKTSADTSALKTSFTSNVDHTILQRIKKILQRANHENTPQQEAKAAFHIASTHMAKYNVSQAEVLAHQPIAEKRKWAGQSVVSIMRANGSKGAVKNQRFVHQLAFAIETFFDCKMYTTRTEDSVDWTFYGITDNTVMAALAFERAYNLIAEWAMEYKGVGAKNSYCLGVADELLEMASEEKVYQEAQARQAEIDSVDERVAQEHTQRRTELARLHALPGGSKETDTTNTDGGDDSDDEMETHFALNGDQPDAQALHYVQIDQLIWPDIKCEIKREPEHDSSHSGPSSLWTTSSQLINFRATAAKIADDYLVGRKVKLSKVKSQPGGVSDYGAYKKGIRDSKKIDVRAKKLEG